MTDAGDTRGTPRQTDTALGHGPAGPTNGRGIELPQLLIALLLVALFALAAVWWLARSTNREPFLALAGNIAEGQELRAEDLTTVFVNTDRPELLHLVPESSAAAYVGTVATADLTAGTLVGSKLFTTAEPVTPGNGLVGTLVNENERTTTLKVGDPVVVVLHDGQTPPTLVAEYNATVHTLNENADAFSGDPEVGVILEMLEPEANHTAAFAALDLIAIVEVER